MIWRWEELACTHSKHISHETNKNLCILLLLQWNGLI